MAASITIRISEMPPSANHMRQHFIKDGKVTSTKAKGYAAWKEAAAWEIASKRPGRIDGPYRLSMAVQRDWKSKRARDIDNTIKPISDALVAAGVIKDDSLAEEVNAKWADNLDGPAVIVIITEAQEALAA
jgi:Holliday junction resolvase RusA-like endonuclease